MTPPTRLFTNRSRLRRPLMITAAAALLAGLWAGLLRIGWQIPPISSQLILAHGPLMVSGFLGIFTSLERAVALSQIRNGGSVYYLSPVLAALGTVALFLPIPEFAGRGLITLAALGLVVIFAIIYRSRPTTDHLVMGTGAVLWLVGNGLWLFGLPVFRVVPWWAGFLVLTIAGERLELARVLLLKSATRKLFYAAILVFLTGLALSIFAFDAGMRLGGLGLIGLGAWLLRFDIARFTIRQKGLTRFIAACLLPGYFWLLISGILWLGYGGSQPAGPVYDAILHTIFVGFVFSMIFGHAPIIIPAVTGVQVVYSPAFYAHLALLHVSLLLRVAGDLVFSAPLRRWGGLLNETAVILFLVLLAVSTRGGMKSRQSAKFPAPEV